MLIIIERLVKELTREFAPIGLLTDGRVGPAPDAAAPSPARQAHASRAAGPAAPE